MAGAMRDVHSRKGVESNLKHKLTERNHQLDDLFEIFNLEMKQKVKKRERPDDDELDEGGRRTVLRTGVIFHKLKVFYNPLQLRLSARILGCGIKLLSQDWSVRRRMMTRRGLLTKM